MKNYKFAVTSLAALTVVTLTAFTVFASGPSSAPTGGNVDAAFNTVTTGNGSNPLGKNNAINATSKPTANGATDPASATVSTLQNVAQYATIVGQANGKDAVGVYGTTDNTGSVAGFSAGIVGNDQTAGFSNVGILGMSSTGIAGMFLTDAGNATGTLFVQTKGTGNDLNVDNEGSGVGVNIYNPGTGNALSVGGSTGGIPVNIDNSNNGSVHPAIQILNNSVKPTGPALQIIDTLNHPIFPWNTNFQIATDGSMSNPTGATNSGAVAVINPKGFITNATTGAAITGTSTDTTTNAVGVAGVANNGAGYGVEGISIDAGVGGFGRIGVNGTDTNGSGWGVDGSSPTNIGVEGDSQTGTAVVGKVSSSGGTAGDFNDIPDGTRVQLGTATGALSILDGSGTTNLAVAADGTLSNPGTNNSGAVKINDDTTVNGHLKATSIGSFSTGSVVWKTKHCGDPTNGYDFTCDMFSSDEQISSCPAGSQVVTCDFQTNDGTAANTEVLSNYQSGGTYCHLTAKEWTKDTDFTVTSIPICFNPNG